MIKKLIYILPMTFAIIASSCGSKAEEKKDGEEKETTKKPETACDCLDIMVAEVKKIDNMDQMEGLEDKLNNEYPECNKLADEFFAKYSNPDEAAKECPAVTELVDVMASLKSSEPSNTDELLEASE